MTADDLAQLHALCFSMPRPWNTNEFKALLDDPKTLILGDARGFIMGRVIVDEAELLTLAIHPEHRRIGLGRQLVGDLITAARLRQAATLFLEVAETNTAAHALYAQCGFVQTGRRRGYYQDATGARSDALILAHAL